MINACLIYLLLILLQDLSLNLCIFFYFHPLLDSFAIPTAKKGSKKEKEKKIVVVIYLSVASYIILGWQIFVSSCNFFIKLLERNLFSFSFKRGRRRYSVVRHFEGVQKCRELEYIFAFPVPIYARRKGWCDAIENTGGQKHALPKSTDFEDLP